VDRGLNRRAARLADAMEAEAGRLGVVATRLPGGARVIDCGIAAPGGLEAGRRLAEVCLAGLGTVTFTTTSLGGDLDGLWLPAVQVVVDDPAWACLASQYAGWAIDPAGYFAMGSGPARALARAERALYEKLGYAEAADEAVLVLEGRTPPTDAVAAHVAGRCGVGPERLTLLIAPTASVAGCVQIAARSVETALHKLAELHFDVRAVESGLGVCPLAPVARNDLRGIGWTNDCILYGTRTYLALRADEATVEALLPQLPSSASPDHGTPFFEIFRRHDHQFYRIDPALFSPAEVTINNLATGRISRAGRLDLPLLRDSLGLS
jgi:methenyltetrahydromethanopterin cyclohydrolase